MARLLLRAIAIAIAIAGIVDPVFTLSRHAKPDVAVIAASRLPDPALTERVINALASRFSVVRGPSLAAAAVVVGHELPAALSCTGRCRC